MKQQIKRLLRWVAGRDWYPGLDFRTNCLRLGSPTAGWTVARDFLARDSVVWCVGIGEDISFDLELKQQFGMEIHAFDPTPRSLDWVRRQPLPAGYHVHPWGLADCDGTVQFRPPDNPEHVSHSMVTGNPVAAPAGTILAEVRRIDSLAELLGQTRIDLLKMDIEGAEYPVIEDLKRSRIRPLQLLVEFHHRQPGIGIARTRAAVTTLRELGYRLFHVSPNGEEYAFLAGQEAGGGMKR